ncbi:MAG: response regulator [Candidatus Hinthialibacter antarcticus]|nr:response regulator [Candidatus Hinthialibacter antarcticus]
MIDSFLPTELKTILFVEDEIVIRETVCEVLGEAGHTMLAAKDGLAACELFDKNIDEVDLVILDLSLPKRSGLEVMDYIRSKRSDMKILVCSGYVDNKRVEKLVRSGAVSFLSKPYQFEQVAAAIRDCFKME